MNCRTTVSHRHIPLDKFHCAKFRLVDHRTANDATDSSQLRQRTVLHSQNHSVLPILLPGRQVPLVSAAAAATVQCSRYSGDTWPAVV